MAANVTRRDAIRFTYSGRRCGRMRAALAGQPSSSGSGTDATEKTSCWVAMVISGPKNDGGRGRGHYESSPRLSSLILNWEMPEPREHRPHMDAAFAAQSQC